MDPLKFRITLPVTSSEWELYISDGQGGWIYQTKNAQRKVVEKAMKRIYARRVRCLTAQVHINSSWGVSGTEYELVHWRRACDLTPTDWLIGADWLLDNCPAKDLDAAHADCYLKFVKPEVIEALRAALPHRLGYAKAGARGSRPVALFRRAALRRLFAQLGLPPVGEAPNRRYKEKESCRFVAAATMRLPAAWANHPQEGDPCKVYVSGVHARATVGKLREGRTPSWFVYIAPGQEGVMHTRVSRNPDTLYPA